MKNRPQYKGIGILPFLLFKVFLKLLFKDLWEDDAVKSRSQYIWGLEILEEA